MKHLTTTELCARWSLRPKTLSNWRHARTGPPFVKIGHRVLYLEADVLQFEQENRIQPRGK